MVPPTFFHNLTLPRAASAGVPTPWPSASWTPLRLRRHEHTFVAFIDIKKAFDSCWVEATLVRLFDFGVTGSLWHLLANFLCGTLSQARLGGSVSPPWVDSGIAQGRILSPLLFNLLIDSLAVTLRSTIPGVSLTTSDSFRHACQLHADDLVVLTASQIDLQLALDAVHAWGVRWRFSFGVGPTKSMVFGPPRGRPDCCVHLGGVPLPSVQQYRYLGIVLSPTLSWRPHVEFLCSRGDRLFHQASAWCLGEGLPLSFSSSVFVTYVLSSSSFGFEYIADDPLALQQFNLALRHWCRHLLGWPSASPVAAVHWELGISDALHLALGRARFSGACPLLIMLHLALRSLPVCSGSPRLRWAPGQTGARLLSTPSPSRSLPTWVSLTGSPPSSLHQWLSREVNPRLHRALRHRLSAMVSDLHGVLVDVSSDNFLPVIQNSVCSFNLPSSAFRLWGLARWGHDHSSTGRPSRHRQGPSTCPFCHDVDGSLMHHLSVCPSHRNARATWAHSCGISLLDASVLALRLQPS